MTREDKTRTFRMFVEVRLGDARAYLQQAAISLQLVDGPQRHATVVSSAILAACDAVCGMALGKVSAGAHDPATSLVVQVDGSSRAVADLSKLVSLKTAAQYAGRSQAERQATDAITRAQRLVAFAESQRRR